MLEQIISFRNLDPTQRQVLANQANWKVDGKNGDWEEVADPRYGVIKHVAVAGEDGTPIFDKLNILWISGVYISAVRINPQGKAEFLLPSERRILLRDENGQQGNVFVDGVAQGAIKEWANEPIHKAALRELREETGYIPNSLVFLGKVALTPANSEIEQPFFLAHIPYDQKPKEQNLEESEDIKIDNRWFTWTKIQGRNWRDGITIIALSLATRVLKPELLKGF